MAMSPHLMTPRLKKTLRLRQLFAVVCLVQSFLLSAPAQFLVRPKPSELRAIPGELDPALLPSGASDRVVETNQIFQLVQKDSPLTLVVPVHFKTVVPDGSGSGTSNNCGVYLMPRGGKATFQLLVSESLVPHEQCFGGVDAMGAHMLPGEVKATPIFIYKAKTPHGIEYRPKILRWSYDADGYIFNPVGSHYLLEQGHVPTTIREVLKIWAKVE